jgi:RNA polymerase sigma factor (sigma-70 family)
MADGPLPDIVQHIRRLADADAGAAPSDAQLLGRFVGQRCEEAFTTLVRRHGPLVLRVCRQLLADAHDAEDAFQATFLVLVRKAGAIGRRELLAGWLYGVAHRVAARVRVQATRRRGRELSSADSLAAATSPDAATRELWGMVHEEVQRLPAKYRQPVVLCYLEGKTLEEAGRLLDWPRGTVSGRLARARDLLHRRLTRRGVAVPAAGGVALLAAGPSSAALPGDLLRGTVAAALVFAAGSPTAGVVSTSVISLAEGVLQTMFAAKLKIIGIVLVVLLAVAVTVGAGVAASRRNEPVPVNVKNLAAEQPEPPKREKEPEKIADEPKDFEPALVKMKPLADDPKDDPLHKLMKERFNAALTEVHVGYQRVEAGQGTVEVFFDAAARLKLAGLEMYDDPKEKIALLEKYVELAKEVERIMKARFEAGKAGEDDVQRVRYFRADAEIALLRLKNPKPAKQ